MGVTTRSLSNELRRRSAARASRCDDQVPEPVLAGELERQWNENPELFLPVSLYPEHEMQSNTCRVCRPSHVMQHHMFPVPLACDSASRFNATTC